MKVSMSVKGPSIIGQRPCENKSHLPPVLPVQTRTGIVGVALIVKRDETEARGVPAG
jgi:hypothetical protein